MRAYLRAIRLITPALMMKVSQFDIISPVFYQTDISRQSLALRKRRKKAKAEKSFP